MRKYMLLLSSILIINACKTAEKSAISRIDKGNELQTVSLGKVHDAHVVFESLTVKFNASLPDINLSGQLKVQKDSVLWISLNKFGFEVARLKATKDSLFFLNRFESTYYMGNYKLFEKLLGISLNYNMLESMLLGNDFECFDTTSYSNTYSENNTIFLFVSRMWNPSCSKNNKVPMITNRIFVDNQTFKINSNIVSTSLYSIECAYSDFQQVDKIMFPHFTEIKVTAFDETQNIKIVYDKPSLGKIDTFPFSVPKSAKPIY